MVSVSHKNCLFPISPFDWRGYSTITKTLLNISIYRFTWDGNLPMKIFVRIERKSNGEVLRLYCQSSFEFRFRINRFPDSVQIPFLIKLLSEATNQIDVPLLVSCNPDQTKCSIISLSNLGF